MKVLTKNVIYHGRKEPLPQRVALQAGPVSLFYEDGNLRYLRLGSREIIRRIYVAVRDQNWGTVPAKLSNVDVVNRPDSFRVFYEAEHRQGSIHFTWKAEIVGEPSGRIVFTIGFNAGYWHASAPTPLRYPASTIESFRKMGMLTNVVAPTGGRAMITRSTDEGKTWSKPETLIDTPADDRHPAFVELRDGTILCSFFTYPGVPEGSDYAKFPELATRINFIRSFDGGKTWEKKPRILKTPFVSDETDGPLMRLKDDSILVAVNGRPKTGPPDHAALFRSGDGGENWELLSTVHTDHELQEVTVAELPDGRFVMMGRPEGDIWWSRDRGRTWTAPATFGMRMFAPSLYVLRDGTLLCLHGSYAPGHHGLRVIFSTDGGETWIAPAKDQGFLVDSSYGYGKAMELEDGSLFICYIATGGHRTTDAQQNAIRSIRLRVRADHSGIELLAAPNRP